jgi:Rad3-related DNA helicase
VAEAGTGTGKTFAYLVPALLAGGKVIISTGTKTLQDQLFHRDLPTVRDALKVAGHHRAAQGPRQLRLPLPPGAPDEDGRFLSREEAGRTCAIARFAKPPDRRQGRVRRRAGGFRRLGPGHLDARQLPRPGMPERQGAASSWRRGARRWRPTWWWSTTTCSSPT